MISKSKSSRTLPGPSFAKIADGLSLASFLALMRVRWMQLERSPISMIMLCGVREETTLPWISEKRELSEKHLTSRILSVQSIAWMRSNWDLIAALIARAAGAACA